MLEKDLESMKSNILISLIVLLAGSQLSANPQQTRRISVAQSHYLRAKRLIENNCVDCMGGTKAGMENGIREIHAALAAGFADHKAAYKLLADAYNAMTTYSGSDQKKSEAFWQKERQALGEVYRLDPLDSEFAVRYANTLKDNRQRLTILKNIAERDPHQADAAFGAGLLMIEMGKPRDGIRFISKAIRNQNNPEAVVNYAQTTLDALQNQNCPLPGAEEWERKFGEAADKATRGEGDPTAMPEVKTQFLQQLERQTCTAQR
jgi:hypothetical protein